MNVQDIVKEYLVAHGYDGLCNPDAGCGCVFYDLAPCGEWCSDCVPEYKHYIPGDSDGDWIVTTSKTPPEAEE